MKFSIKSVAFGIAVASSVVFGTPELSLAQSYSYHDCDVTGPAAYIDGLGLFVCDNDLMRCRMVCTEQQIQDGDPRCLDLVGWAALQAIENVIRRGSAGSGEQSTGNMK